MSERTNETVRAATEGPSPEPTGSPRPSPDGEDAVLSPEEERFVEAFVAYWMRRGAEIRGRGA
jgi:hypothetical protein